MNNVLAWHFTVTPQESCKNYPTSHFLSTGTEQLDLSGGIQVRTRAASPEFSEQPLWSLALPSQVSFHRKDRLFAPETPVITEVSYFPDPAHTKANETKQGHYRREKNHKKIGGKKTQKKNQTLKPKAF